MSKQRLQTATTDITEKIVVTHPHISTSGNEYVLKMHKKIGIRIFLLCEDKQGNEVLLPIEHTNLGKPRLSESQQEGVPYFAYNDLVELRRIINNARNVSS